jgi:hypothetical protein
VRLVVEDRALLASVIRYKLPSFRQKVVRNDTKDVGLDLLGKLQSGTDIGRHDVASR